MDFTVNARMAEYYERFIELQEKLRKSEEERMKLEMKFNEMMQKSREEEHIYFRRLRSQYKQFLEEDRKRQERNEKIVRTLERIETRIDMLTSKTERFKGLRRQYQNYLQRISDHQAPKRVQSTSYNLPKENYDVTEEVFEPAKQKFNEEKMEILDRYLESISSQRCKELIEKRKQENAQLEKLDTRKYKLNNNFDSNKAQSIAEDIMNSIYNRHYNKSKNGQQKIDVPKVKLNNDLGKSDMTSDEEESLPDLQQKDTSIDCATNVALISTLNKDLNTQKNKDELQLQNKRDAEKLVFVEDSHAIKLVPNEVVEDKHEEVSQMKAKCNEDKIVEDPTYEFTPHNLSKMNNFVANETEDFVEVKKLNHNDNEKNIEKYESNEILNEESKIEENKKQESLSPSNDEVDALENKTKIEEELVRKTNENKCLHEDDQNIDTQYNENEENIKHLTDEQETSDSKQEKRQTAELNQQHFHENSQPVQCDENSEAIKHYENSLPIQNDENDQAIHYDQNSHPIQHDQNGQSLQYNQNDQLLQYDQNGQPVQYDQDDQPIQYDQNGQPIQYDQNGQPIQYDQNGQPIQYDQNGQPIQYDQSGQPIQYDQSGQPVLYDENGQPVQYNVNTQPAIDYDENGQPMQYGQEIQYDENGQPIYFDENGQPLQYDENGQALYQYQQYDEQGQPVQQYDEQGQPIQQYDENGQLVQQYGEYDNQNYPQVDENRQAVQDYMSEEKKQIENEHFGEEVLPSDNFSEENTEMKEETKTNKILEILDTDSESVQHNASKVSNDSDFNVSM